MKIEVEATGTLAIVAAVALGFVFAGAFVAGCYELVTSSALASPSSSRDANSAADDYRRCMAECLGREESAQ